MMWLPAVSERNVIHVEKAKENEYFMIVSHVPSMNRNKNSDIRRTVFASGLWRHNLLIFDAQHTKDMVKSEFNNVIFDLSGLAARCGYNNGQFLFLISICSLLDAISIRFVSFNSYSQIDSPFAQRTEYQNACVRYHYIDVTEICSRRPRWWTLNTLSVSHACHTKIIPHKSAKFS